MDNTTVATEANNRKASKRIGKEVWYPLVTREERKRRQALAVAFLDRFGRD